MVMEHAVSPTSLIPDGELDLGFAATGLRTVVRGRALGAADDGYTSLVAPFNLDGAYEPDAAVEVLEASDVAAVLRYAVTRGYEVAVQLTGHGAARRVDRPPTIMVHTGRLDELSIHGSAVRVGAGVRWAAVLELVGAHGLAAPAGAAPGVGVVGYLTGGGLSPVGRTTGYACDHVTAFEVVTGDGIIRRASAVENSELFWGLRGGKGALGIVTAVEMSLIPLPEIFGGCVYVDAASDADMVQAWRAWCDDLPDEATTSIAVMRFPNTPAVPEPLAGRCTLALRYAWTGDPAAGGALIAPLMTGREVLAGGFDVMPFSSLGAIHADPVEPMPVQASSVLLRQLDADAVTALMSVAGAESDCPQVMTELRLLGGALFGTGAPDSAVSHHRQAAYLLQSIGLAIPQSDAAGLDHWHLILAALDAWTLPVTLPNFGSWATPAAVAGQYDPQTLARLGALAADYDPDGVLSDATMLQAACRERTC